MRTCLLFLGVLVIMTGAARLRSQTSGPTLKKVAEFDLPGPPGKRFDYLTIDSGRPLLDLRASPRKAKLCDRSCHEQSRRHDR